MHFMNDQSMIIQGLNMKIVTMAGGLGAQIIKYMFFLDVKEKSEDQEVLIDTSCFGYHDIWNGYELERLFGIKERDIWDEICREEQAAWKIKGKYRERVLHYCYSVLCQNVCYYHKGHKHLWTEKKDLKYREGKEKDSILLSYMWKAMWYIRFVLKRSEHMGDRYPSNYMKQSGITYFDDFNHISNKYLCKNRKLVKDILRFPAFEDERDKLVSSKMCTEGSVALHVRRSDHMYDNGSLFRRQYFKKAVAYMRENIEKPVFYIFSEDKDWCANNITELGIQEEDSYLLVDWNAGQDSYRDMQLMTYCKHNILVMSSFSWCGYYLSIWDDKKVVAPNGWWLEVPIHM